MQITAAEALCNLGKTSIATPILINAVSNTNLMVRVHALNSLEIIGGDVAKAAIPTITEMLKGKTGRDYDVRAGKRLVALYN